MLDTLIRGGNIVDGTGAPRFKADLAIDDGRVVDVGSLEGAEASKTLDATGMIVSPGFIDIHSHSDFTLLVDPRAQSSIAQGATTEVIGNCGHGCAPLTKPKSFVGNIYGYSDAIEMDWRTTEGYLERMGAARPAVNVAALVPNGNLRLAVMPRTEAPATPDEIAQMGHLLEEGLEAGAFGYSTGLESPDERASTEEETAELCRIVARRGALYATHTRNKETLAVEAVEEGIRVAHAAGVQLQVSHIIPRKGGPPDALERAIDAVDRAAARSLDVTFDQHTRLHGITPISAALPAWAFEGGADSLAARLREPVFRSEMKLRESLFSSFALGGWDRVYLYQSKGNPDLVGKSFEELAPSGGDAYDALFDILLEECEEPHASLAVCHSYEEDQLRYTFRHPLCMVGSDATALGTDGPLAGDVFLGAFTWAGWFFRRLVRETGDLTIEEAVAKLAAAPADRLGIADRGRIARGSCADVVVFDAAGFAERGTLESPNRLATGVAHVVVNGVVSMEDGALTSDRGGHVLRRG
jgi:N-acyl-D-amino-acid deacylase